MSVSLIIIIATALVSFSTFNNPETKYKLIFYPHKIQQSGEYYRFLSSGLIHADIAHLAFNMITLYFFGEAAEMYISVYLGAFPMVKFLILYFGGMVCASAYAYFKHKDNPGYMALGASGAVSAVLFSTILFDPWNWILIFGLIPIPGIVFGIGYVIYSAKMAKESRDNIGHDAHLYGAIFGVVITLAYNPGVVIEKFMNSILNPTWPF